MGGACLHNFRGAPCLHLTQKIPLAEARQRGVLISPLEEEGGQGDRVCVMNVDGADVRYFTDLSRDVFVLRWNPKGESLIAEVSQHNTTSRDVEWVSYPWNDAGATGGGGDNGNGGGGTGIGWWDDLMAGYGGYLLVVIGVIVIVAIGGTYYHNDRKRKRETAAEELRRQMEAEAERERARQRPPEDEWGGKNVRAEDFSSSYWAGGDVGHWR